MTKPCTSSRAGTWFLVSHIWKWATRKASARSCKPASSSADTTSFTSVAWPFASRSICSPSNKATSSPDYTEKTKGASPFLTRRCKLKAVERIRRIYGLKIRRIWRRKFGVTRAKSFLIWRMNFSEMARKNFLFGASFFDHLRRLENITHLHIFSHRLPISSD